MPSPIAHTAIGYLIYKVSKGKIPEANQKKIGSVPLLLIVTVAFAMLPDLDAILGVLSGEFGKYHNNGTHSIIAGFAVVLLVAGGIWWKQRVGFWAWFLILFSSYFSHVIMDYFTIGGRGVMLFWPISLERFDSAVKLFYGVRWSAELFSVKHLWTIGTELIVVLIVVLVSFFIEGKNNRGVKQLTRPT